MQINNIDFNCDLAQGLEDECELLDYASSAGIPCGFHAGTPAEIRDMLLLTKDKNVAIGALIGFKEVRGFNYIKKPMPDDELEALVIYQVGALMSFAKTMNMEVEYVRAQGAMYDLAAKNFDFAKIIAGALKKTSQWLVYYGAAGETTQRVADELSVPVAHEVFLEKMYNVDGTIDASARDNENIEMMLGRLKHLMATSQVPTNMGEKITLPADTIHFSSKDLIVKAREIVTPAPVNYKNAVASGWLE
jgi:UPF0271 protein